MKALLVNIFAIYTTYILCLDNKHKGYPKKYKTYVNGKILINYAKYEKTDPPAPLNKYTAFQVVGSNHNLKMIQSGVPDSPYFPVDQGYDQKARVKKVLPEYPWTFLRNKRSAVLDVSATTKDNTKIDSKATDEVKTTKAITTMATKGKEEKTTVAKSSPPKEHSKSTINTTQAKAVTKNKETERSGAHVVKKNEPVRKGVQAVPKTAAKVSSGRTNRKPKSKAKAAALIRSNQKGRQGKSKGREAKPKDKQAKSNGRQAKSKARQGKSKGRQAKTGNKPRGSKAAGNKYMKRKGNLQRSKNQKAKPKNGRTGINPKETRRLTAAREALIEDYPYVVSIQKDEQHWCSGALLNQRMVITTANCLWKATHISRMKVRAGSRHSNRGGQVAGIQEIMKHPGWGLRKAPDNDVALLLLDKNLKWRFIDDSALVCKCRFSDAVHGVDLPNRAMLPAFDDAWITSWGAERRDGIYDPKDSTSLQVYHAQLLDREKCNNVTMRFSVIVSENFICLAQSGRQAPCTRDTGAPAVSDGILWGLASWGIRKLCGTERFPAVFSYIASHSNMDFIMNGTRFLMSDKRQYPFPDRYPESLMHRK